MKYKWDSLPKGKREALTKLLDIVFEPNRHVFYQELFDEMMKILEKKP